MERSCDPQKWAQVVEGDIDEKKKKLEEEESKERRLLTAQVGFQPPIQGP